MTFIDIFTVLITICSWISIPSTVPFTLQTFAVFLALGLLGGKQGTLATLVYILLGAMGVPVFSGFTGGIGILLGNTGGYIIGFLGAALTMWAITHIFGDKQIILAISMVLGLLVCYIFGTIWFMVVYLHNIGTVSLVTVLSWCVFPFIIPDIVKIYLALMMTKRLKKYMPI